MYCFFDIVIGKHPVSTITFELYSKDLPKTCANFAALCSSEQMTPKQQLTYQNTKFFRITKNIMAQGGDVVTNDGRGSLSIYGPNFKDENFKYRHDQRGLLTMINSGPNTNGSQFAITFLPCPWLDRKQMVFGKVIEGQQTLTLLESIGTDNGVPKALAKIVSCGVALAPAPNSYLTQHKPIQTEESKAAEKQQSQGKHSKDQSRDLKSSLQSEDQHQYQDDEELGGSLQQSQFDQQQSKKSSVADIKKSKDQSDDDDEKVDKSKDLKRNSRVEKDQSPEKGKNDEKGKSQKLDSSKDTSKSKEQSEIKVKGEDKKDDKNGKSDKKANDDQKHEEKVTKKDDKKDEKAGNAQKEQKEEVQDKKKQEVQPEQQKPDKSQDLKGAPKKK